MIGLTPPSKDSFYSPPVGFATAKPGDILKLETLPVLLVVYIYPLLLKRLATFNQIRRLFWKSNAFVATLIQPLNANPSKLVSYQSWEDASHIDCSPSYGMQFKSPATTVTTQIDMTLIVPLLQNGYYVIIPDYEGPKSTFTVGRQSGKATLNSIRAALQTGAFSGIKNCQSCFVGILWWVFGYWLGNKFTAEICPRVEGKFNRCCCWWICY